MPLKARIAQAFHRQHRQIAAIFGHASRSEVARYTREANQAYLADDAMDILEQAETRTGRVEPARQFALKLLT